MSNAELFLKKTLGEDFMESLAKVELWKPGTRSTIDHEELKTALQIVPRTVMSLLIRELAPMAVGETKEVNLFVAGNAMMRVTKHERDVYSGEIEQDNKKVVDFKFRALPGVGLVIMSAFELYDMENLINASDRNMQNPMVEDAEAKVQRMIDERISMTDLVNKVVDRKMMERQAIHEMMMTKLTDELQAMKSIAAAQQEVIIDHQNKHRQIADLREMQERTTPQTEEYFRGMTNGLEVANATVNNHEPKFVEPQKKVRPLKEFLEGRKKKPSEFSIQVAKGETISCPDCKKNIFDGAVFSGCICLGDDRERKVFIKKSEDGIKVRFSRGWDQENIEMLLEVLRRKRG